MSAAGEGSQNDGDAEVSPEVGCGVEHGIWRDGFPLGELVASERVALKSATPPPGRIPPHSHARSVERIISLVLFPPHLNNSRTPTRSSYVLRRSLHRVFEVFAAN
jgi:hypothetical protein